MKQTAATAAIGIALSGCAITPDRSVTPQEAFFTSLRQLCDKAYAGALVSEDAADAEMRGQPMVMHVRRCSSDRIEIPFHIAGIGPEGDWDRSRTWVITRTATGLRLKHDHRHADGSNDALTLYGGDTNSAGTATRQTFPVDAESITLFKAEGRTASVTNIWAIEVSPGQFAYELRRAGRHFRVSFDLTQPVAAPPTPWGW